MRIHSIVWTEEFEARYQADTKEMGRREWFAALGMGAELVEGGLLSRLEPPPEAT